MMKTSVQFVLCDILKMLFNSNFSHKYIYAIWSQHFSHMILQQSPQKTRFYYSKSSNDGFWRIYYCLYKHSFTTRIMVKLVSVENTVVNFGYHGLFVVKPWLMF